MAVKEERETNDNLEELLQAAAQQSSQDKRQAIKSQGTMQEKLIEQANNKLEDFIDNFDTIKLPS